MSPAWLIRALGESGIGPDAFRANNGLSPAKRIIMTRRLCVVAVITVATATVLLGQTASGGAGRNPRPKSPRTKAAEELTHIEEQWHEALEKADVATLDHRPGGQRVGRGEDTARG